MTPGPVRATDAAPGVPVPAFVQRSRSRYDAIAFQCHDNGHTDSSGRRDIHCHCDGICDANPEPDRHQDPDKDTELDCHDQPDSYLEQNPDPAPHGSAYANRGLDPYHCPHHDLRVEADGPQSLWLLMKYFLLAFLLLAKGASSDVSLDSTSTFTSAGTAVSSLTYSHTTGSGNNRALVVWADQITGGGAGISGATWNGHTLTAFQNGNSTFLGVNGFRGVFYWLNPEANTTANVVVSFGSGGGAMSKAYSYAGVTQTTPLSNFAVTTYSSGTGTSTVSYTAAQAGGAIDMGWIADASTNATLDPGFTDQTKTLKGLSANLVTSTAHTYSILNTATANTLYSVAYWEVAPAPNDTATTTLTTTPTLTQSPTLTQTQTFTYSPTTTNSPTPSVTQSWTVSPTPTITQTFTDSPTPTITDTFTFSPTLTITQTFTDSPTPSVTPTWTDSPTLTMTQTFTDSPTPSATQTFTDSPTPTATQTQTPTATPTHTPTSTPTATPTPTATATPTESPTPTASPTLVPQIRPIPENQLYKTDF